MCKKNPQKTKKSSMKEMRIIAKNNMLKIHKSGSKAQLNVLKPLNNV